MSFDNIIEGKLLGLDFDFIICSFALHLCEKSKLPMLLYQLSLISPNLYILTPHKNPNITSDMFWCLKEEILLNKVRLRKYSSIIM